MTNGLECLSHFESRKHTRESWDRKSKSVPDWAEAIAERGLLQA